MEESKENKTELSMISKLVEAFKIADKKRLGFLDLLKESKEKKFDEQTQFPIVCAIELFEFKQEMYNYLCLIYQLYQNLQDKQKVNEEEKSILSNDLKKQIESKNNSEVVNNIAKANLEKENYVKKIAGLREEIKKRLLN